MMLKFLLFMGLALVCQSYKNSSCPTCFDTGTYKCGPDGECICNVGFTDDSCDFQKGCDDAQCGSGTCVYFNNQFECKCPEGHWGRLCEHSDSEVEHLQEIEKNLSLKHCAGKEENCKPAHLQVVCGTEDLVNCDKQGKVRPFKNCPYPWYCFEAFRNGKCDWECERKECLYDGYECSTKRECDKFCILSNGSCDEECDLGARRTESESKVVPIIVEISLGIPEKEFLDKKEEILANLSEPLRIPLLYDKGHNADLEAKKTVPSRARRSISKENAGATSLLLGMDLGVCRNPSHCTPNCETAKQLLVTTKAKGELAQFVSMRCPPPGYGNIFLAGKSRR